LSGILAEENKTYGKHERRQQPAAAPPSDDAVTPESHALCFSPKTRQIQASEIPRNTARGSSMEPG
jgi:hypothetical protein